MNRLLVALALIVSPYTFLRADHPSIDCQHQSEIFIKAKGIMEGILTEDERNHWVVDTYTESKDFIQVLWKPIMEDPGKFPGHLEVTISLLSDDYLNLDLFNLFDQLIFFKDLLLFRKLFQNDYHYNRTFNHNEQDTVDYEIIDIGPDVTTTLRKVRRLMLEEQELISIGFGMWENFGSHFPIENWEQQQAYWLERFCAFDPEQRPDTFID